MVAFKQVVPHIPDRAIVDACMSSGFTEWLGMLPHQIEIAADVLGLKYTVADLLQYKPTHCTRDRRKAMTLNQALAATSTKVCLIRITGHIIASNCGVPIDPNMKRRGARRRVLGIYVLHNATIAKRQSWDISGDPSIQFVHDVRHDTRSGSSRAAMYDEIFDFLVDPMTPARLSELKSFGYTRKMLKRHIERGDVIVVT
jgi:hypothetical protein